MTALPRRWLPQVLASVVILAVGFAAGRGLGTEVSGAAGTVVAPETTPVTPPGLDGTATASGNRASSRRTRDGAVVAATAYAVAMDGPGILDSEQRRELLDQIAATEARDRLDAVLGRVGSVLTGQLGLTPSVLADDTFVWRAVPAGWQVHAYAADHAQVAVWGTGIAMANGRPLAQPAWRTTIVDLTWERGDWRVVSVRSEPGPQPPIAGNESTGEQVAPEINRFEPFAYAPPSESRP